MLDDPRGPLERTHPVQRAILVEDLLTHTSGLAYGIFGVRADLAGLHAAALQRGSGRLAGRTRPRCRWCISPANKVTYSHSTDVLGVIVSRIEGKPFYQVLDERILGPAGMPDTGFFVSAEARRRAATMYQLDDDDQLRHDVMGPPHIDAAGVLQRRRRAVVDRRRLPAIRADASGRRSVDGVRVLSPESVRLMRTDRLTDEQQAGTTSWARRIGWAAGSD